MTGGENGLGESNQGATPGVPLISMKRAWLLRLLTIAFIWVVVSRWAELGKLAAALAQARWQWVLAAALLQLLFYLAYTALYQVSLRAAAVGGHRPKRALQPASMAAPDASHGDALVACACRA